jgi:hypothetical protein
MARLHRDSQRETTTSGASLCPSEGGATGGSATALLPYSPADGSVWEWCQRRGPGRMGPLDWWTLRLYACIEDWAIRKGLGTGSVQQQQRIVGELLGLGEEVLDTARGSLEHAMVSTQTQDNLRLFFIACLSSGVERRGGRLSIRLGRKARRKDQSLAQWIWVHLLRPWLPEARRATGEYRRQDARVWEAAATWFIAVTGNDDGVALFTEGRSKPQTHATPDTVPRWDSEVRDERQRNLRAFAEALSHVRSGRLAVWSEPPPDPRETPGGRLSPANVIRNAPEVRQALYRAYVLFGGREGDNTGREAPLRRLAVFLAAWRPAYWPPASKRHHAQSSRRDLKVEVNRLRREMNLLGTPRRSST